MLLFTSHLLRFYSFQNSTEVYDLNAQALCTLTRLRSNVHTRTNHHLVPFRPSHSNYQGATYFPNATIIGTDLSPIQPNEVPANVHFVIDDASEPDWEYQPHEHFDYIFARCLLGSLGSYKMMIKNAFKYLNPGNGFLECHEWLLDLHCDDDSLASTRDYPFRDWISYAHQSSATSLDPPRPLRIAHKIAGWMREAGFVDVHEKVDMVPINAWSRDAHLKNIGKWHMTNWLDGLGGFSYGLFGPRGLNWSQTQIEVFLIGVRKSIQDKNVRAYQNFYCVTGRKPKVDEGSEEDELDEDGVQKEDEGLGEEGEGE
jgi:Methyltransferase domain